MAGAPTRLSQLLKRANAMLIHQQTVREALDPACRPHCWLANFRNGTLYLQSDSAAWGTRLRMQQRALITQLRKHALFSNLQAVRVSIEPRYPVQKRTHKARSMSAENARYLEETAQTTEDAALAEALKKLACHGQKTS